MRSKKQLWVAALIVIAALTVVTARLLSGGADALQESAEGHDMAAMTAGSGEMNPVLLTREGGRRIGVAFTIAEYRTLPLLIRSVGTVAYDETRLATVSPKLEGWVEMLYVDFTGAPVRAGQPLMEVYSPQLVSAQEELILAARLVAEAGPGRASENAAQLLESAQRRLSYWDIPQDQIQSIQESLAPTKTLTLRSPASGIVVEKNVVQGDRIMPGMTVYRIADLSRVWIEVDVFEKDVALVAEGQVARLTFEAFPGRAFSARVTYVHPTVSMQSRTARVRLEVPNPELLLKPGMYAEINLELPPLEATVIVPRSSVIDTGERSLVFVQSEGGTLLPREVTVGRASGQFTQILAGLAVGERVVSSAAFLVDAESNLGTMTGDMDQAPPGSETMEGMEGMAPSEHESHED
jgi:Cu(I)/Ag(I) efflux system membrane fusion protein